MAESRASFEIQSFQNNHWVTEQVRETENLAKSLAEKLIKRPDCVGIRVVKNWTRSDGLVTETVVYEETREADEKPVTIAPIDAAPLCREMPDYYKWESRNTINRLLARYIDKVNMTTTELMHNYSALKKVQEVDTLFPSAVDRVATLQAKVANVDPRARRDELYQQVNRMTDRVRRAEARGLPVARQGLTSLFDSVTTLADAEDAEFYGRVSVCRDLVKERSWLAKLDMLAKMVGVERRPTALALVDGIFADLISTAQALQDILGQQRNLAKALIAMADLYDGTFNPERSDARDQLLTLAPLMAAGLFTETRASLMDRIQRQLGSPAPLAKNDVTQEQDALREVVARLFRDQRVLGGPATAAALTRRFLNYQEAGGKAGLRNALGAVNGMLSDPLLCVVYLVALAGSDLGGELMEAIVGALAEILNVNDLAKLAPRVTAPKDRLIRIKQIFDHLEAASALPEPARKGLIDRLDTVLAEYIRREGIIERLDDPKATLHDRAIRLVEFCGAGLLPNGRALRTARERVIGLLRQPNFTQRFVENIRDPALAERELRDFHVRLARGGFS